MSPRTESRRSWTVKLYATPRPSPRHARASSSLGVTLGGPFDHGRGGPGGWYLLDEPELHLAADVVVPDLAGWRRERLPALPTDAYIALAPKWVCEILSPSTASTDRVRKLRIYARERVSHAWLIDPLARTLEGTCGSRATARRSWPGTPTVTWCARNRSTRSRWTCLCSGSRAPGPARPPVAHVGPPAGPHAVTTTPCITG